MSDRVKGLPPPNGPACVICGDEEPAHVHDGKTRIEDYFTVGRGETDFLAAVRWRDKYESILPAVLLRDTPEDRERLWKTALKIVQDRRIQIVENDAEGMGRLVWVDEFTDAIIAALRGERSVGDA